MSDSSSSSFWASRAWRRLANSNAAAFTRSATLEGIARDFECARLPRDKRPISISPGPPSRGVAVSEPSESSSTAWRSFATAFPSSSITSEPESLVTSSSSASSSSSSSSLSWSVFSSLLSSLSSSWSFDHSPSSACCASGVADRVLPFGCAAAFELSNPVSDPASLSSSESWFAPAAAGSCAFCSAAAGFRTRAAPRRERCCSSEEGDGEVEGSSTAPGSSS
mmetsp:Transcript_101813/g.294633  ORF Transcript_101813/g.294633 Transcript_101813/m.294633 type:complete len:223 (+) Transcript_101813:1-669(+)